MLADARGRGASTRVRDMFDRRHDGEDNGNSKRNRKAAKTNRGSILPGSLTRMTIRSIYWRRFSSARSLAR
jgi:hypothetical protein